MNRGWLGLFVLAPVLGALACGGDGATEPQIDTRTVTLAAMKNSGITGTATIRTEEGAETSTVTVALQGLTSATSYVGHIHNTSCAEGGGIARALPNITGAANGTGSATAQVGNDTLTSAHYVQYHLDIPGFPEIACGDILGTGESATRSVWLLEVNLSGVDGFAVISDLVGPTAWARVDLLKGLTNGTDYDGHIHVTSCASAGTVRLPLPVITGTAGGTGSSGAVVVQDSLLTANHYFQYHLTGPQIACGDIPGGGVGATRRVVLAQINASGISGEAVVSDTAGPTSAVRVVLEGTATGTEYDGHVHQGSCADPAAGGIVHTLTSVTGETGGTPTATSRGVMDNELGTGFYFQYHDGAPGVVCGNLTGSVSNPEPPPPPEY